LLLICVVATITVEGVIRQAATRISPIALLGGVRSAMVIFTPSMSIGILNRTAVVLPITTVISSLGAELVAVQTFLLTVFRMASSSVHPQVTGVTPDLKAPCSFRASLRSSSI